MVRRTIGFRLSRQRNKNDGTVQFPDVIFLDADFATAWSVHPVQFLGSPSFEQGNKDNEDRHTQGAACRRGACGRFARYGQEVRPDGLRGGRRDRRR
ncbi:hypothetical protein MTBUT4_150058 [Magnetospirillum sp. UT-4]|nr:hypothetical protein MTBUT4_150058 [Magnetospirillum sp. UT-4]